MPEEIAWAVERLKLEALPVCILIRRKACGSHGIGIPTIGPTFVVGFASAIVLVGADVFFADHQGVASAIGYFRYVDWPCHVSKCVVRLLPGGTNDDAVVNLAIERGCTSHCARFAAPKRGLIL